MRRLTNITAEPHQRHVILFNDSEIRLTLRFHELLQFWTFDVEYKGRTAIGVKLSLSTLHIESSNLPFDFLVYDNTQTGLDPFKADDFLERCNLYILEPEDMQNIRGAPVEI